VSAGVPYVHAVAPVGLHAFSQGLFAGVHSHLSQTTSGLVGAFLLRDDESGFKNMFGWTAIMSGAGIILYCVRHLFFTS
jgi:hypothetical protein